MFDSIADFKTIVHQQQFGFYYQLERKKRSLLIMKKYPIVVLSFITLTLGGVALVRAQTPEVEAESHVDPATLQAAYDAHLANSATGTSDSEELPSDQELIASNFGCPKDTVFWMRDSLTPLCQPACQSDADCQGVDGRCRVLDPDDTRSAPRVVIADDMSNDELAHALAAPNVVMVCDPFYDVMGATDLGAQH